MERNWIFTRAALSFPFTTYYYGLLVYDIIMAVKFGVLNATHRIAPITRAGRVREGAMPTRFPHMLDRSKTWRWRSCYAIRLVSYVSLWGGGDNFVVIANDDWTPMATDFHAWKEVILPTKRCNVKPMQILAEKKQGKCFITIAFWC